jgi:hypothetical protein
MATETEGKRIRIARSSVDGAHCVTKFYVGDEPGAWPVLRTDTSAYSDRIQHELAATGLAYLQTQAYAGETQDPEVAMSLVRALHTSLNDGTWQPGRVGDGSGSGPTELVLALERVLAKNHVEKPGEYQEYTRQQIEDMVEPMTPAEKRKLHADPALAGAIADIRMEKARKLKASVKGKPAGALGALFGKPSLQAAE